MTNVLVLSVNFILNEHYLWEEQEVSESAVKHWKMLQRYSTIVWVCLKMDSLKKLTNFAKNNGLRLDGVYLVVQKKSKKLLTVNYSPVEHDFDKNGHNIASPIFSKLDKRMVVINGLLVESTNNLGYSSFYNSIPILKNSRSIIHFTKIDLTDHLRLNSVMRILSQQHLPDPYNLMSILYEFRSFQEDSEKECNCDLSKYNFMERDMLEELEQMKLRMVKFFSQSLSAKLTDKVDDSCSNSVQFLIGDSIRRNYRIFKHYEEFSEGYHCAMYPRAESNN